MNDCDWGIQQNCVELYKAGAVKPLVGLLVTGSADAQSNASGALAAMANMNDDYETAIGEAGGVVPLVNLMKTGSAKVQEEVTRDRGHRP